MTAPQPPDRKFRQLGTSGVKVSVEKSDLSEVVPTPHPTEKYRVSSSNPRGISIVDEKLIESLDKYSMEDVVELKISRFLDQMGNFQPENMHDLIMCKVEKPLLVQILRRVGGNQVQASRILGINRNTLRKKMKSYNI